MTPRQFSYLVKRFEEGQKREDHRAGEIIAMIYNAHRDTEVDRKGLSWDDWFPYWKKEPSEPEDQTEEEMFEVMKAFAAAHPEGLSH